MVLQLLQFLFTLFQQARYLPRLIKQLILQSRLRLFVHVKANPESLRLVLPQVLQRFLCLRELALHLLLHFDVEGCVFYAVLYGRVVLADRVTTCFGWQCMDVLVLDLL